MTACHTAGEPCDAHWWKYLLVYWVLINIEQSYLLVLYLGSLTGKKKWRSVTSEQFGAGHVSGKSIGGNNCRADCGCVKLEATKQLTRTPTTNDFFFYKFVFYNLINSHVILFSLFSRNVFFSLHYYPNKKQTWTDLTNVSDNSFICSKKINQQENQSFYRN